MARFTGLIVIVLVAMGAVLWAVQSPNEISFQGPGFEGSTSRAALALVAVVIGAVMAVVWWMFGWVWDLPGRISRTAKRLRSKRARESIAEGLLAAEGGDAAAAARAAGRILQIDEDGLGSRKLAMLLRARAHEANENWLEAERAYSDLAREKGGELAGLRGLAAAAIKRGDHRTAILHAQSAIELKSQAPWPFLSMLEFQTKSGDWAGAIATLADGEKRSILTADGVRRRRAVLLTAEAAEKRTQDAGEAERLALDALKAAPGFPPAAVIAARLALAAGRAGKAQSILETAWRNRPHPALTMVWADLKPGEDQRARARRLRTLAEFNPEHRESRILIAEASIAEGDWPSAYEALLPLVNESPSARLCTLMEAVARGRGDTEDAHRWAHQAASAPREPDWSDLDPDGRAFNYTDDEWARLVYQFGDAAQLIHPRYESYGRELEALARVALPAPRDEETSRTRKKKPAAQPIAKRDADADEPALRSYKPPAPDYAPED